MHAIVEARPVVSRSPAKRICQFIASVWIADQSIKDVLQKTEDKQLKAMLGAAAVTLRSILRRYLNEIVPVNRASYIEEVLEHYRNASDTEFAGSLNFNDAVPPSLSGRLQIDCVAMLLQSFNDISKPSIYELSALIGKLQLVQDIPGLRKKISDMYPGASVTDVPFLFLTGSFV